MLLTRTQAKDVKAGDTILVNTTLAYVESVRPRKDKVQINTSNGHHLFRKPDADVLLERKSPDTIVKVQTPQHGKGRYYGDLVIRLRVEVFDKKLDLTDPDCQDWLETNLESDIKAVLNYAKAGVSLGADGEGRVTQATGGW